MKIGRRSFLSLGLGVIAGINMTPVPWKLTDDLSIWTQNWPWTPEPPDGAYAFEDSICTLCPGYCGISVRKVGERPVKIEGRQEFPGNNGAACPLCVSGLQLLYGNTRYKGPLARAGRRGEGRWKQISWDEAISQVTQQLGRLNKQAKPQSLVCISGSEIGVLPNLFKRLLTSCGSPNFLTMPDAFDTYSAMLNLMHGKDGVIGVDVENADYILSFGSGFLEGWGQAARMFRAKSMLKDKGGKFVQVEPRLSATAAKADAWIPAKPGTEAALALGLAHVIISKGLYNKRFVNDFSFRYNDYTDPEGKEITGFKNFVLNHYSPETVEKITGVSKDTIIKLAEEFANAGKSLAVCGKGKAGTPGAMQEFMAVHALNALCGNINRPGGVWAMDKPDYVRWDAPVVSGSAEKGLSSPRIDGAKEGAGRMHMLKQAFLNGKPYPAEVLFVLDADPCYHASDADKFKEALLKIPFIVSFSPYMNETSEMADLILPNHGFLERLEDTPAPVGFTKPMLGLAKPVVEPQYNTRHAGDLVLTLAASLGGEVADSFPWQTYEECLESTLGEAWETLREEGYLVNEDYKVPGWKNAFGTGNKRFSFPTKDAFPKDVPLPGSTNAFPLVLLPFDSMRISTAPVVDPPFMIKTVPDTQLKQDDIVVQVNPGTAKSLGLKEGDFASLSTPNGESRVRVHLFDGIMPGVIAMPNGLGHTAGDKYSAGKGVNVNRLLGPSEDPVTGFDAAWGIRAKLAPA